VHLLIFANIVFCFVLFLQTIDRLASHLQNHLPKEAKVKIHNIAIEYVKCQVGLLTVKPHKTVVVFLCGSVKLQKTATI